ncbi:MAG: hypothetical protein RLZZ156_2212 [Deinococcota bacterium]
MTKLPKNTRFFLYGKWLVALRERADLDYDLIAFSSSDTTFAPEPRLYAMMIFDRDDLVRSINEEEFCRLLEERGGRIEELAKLLDEGLGVAQTKETQITDEHDVDYMQFVGIYPLDQDAVQFTRELRDADCN